jgi:hypothetical protein
MSPIREFKTRRTFLSGIGAACAGLAGCASDGGTADQTSRTTEQKTSTHTQRRSTTRTRTQTRTRTEAETRTQTETQTTDETADQTETDPAQTTEQSSGGFGELHIVDSGLYRNGTVPDWGDGSFSSDESVGLLVRIKNGRDEPRTATIQASLNGYEKYLEDKEWGAETIDPGGVREVLFIFVPRGQYTPPDIENYQVVASSDENGGVDQEVLADESVGSELSSPIEIDPESVSVSVTEQNGIACEMTASNNTEFDLGAWVTLTVEGYNVEFAIGPIPAGSRQVPVSDADESSYWEQGAQLEEVESVSVWSGTAGAIDLDD